MLRNMNDLWEDPEESARRGPWKCAACGIDNRSDRTDCRICMCPRDNLCLRCKKVNEAKARFCRFCGSPTAFSHYQVFDPEAKKQAIRDSREMDRKYRSVGHYFQWEDGPDQG